MCNFDGDFDGIDDWEDWMIIGPMSEEISRENQERDKAIQDNNTSESDYWEIINEK